MAWRDTARPAKLWFLDARSVIPLLLFFLHIQLWTFIVAIISIILFWFANNKGYTLPVAFRLIRSKLAGKRKYGTPRRLERGLYD